MNLIDLKLDWIAAGDYFLFYTGAHAIVNIRWLQVADTATWFAFKVRACTEVYIYLASTFDITTSYKIIIGATLNTKSQLYGKTRDSNLNTKSQLYGKMTD